MNTAGSWRNCPFTPGRKYLVLKDFVAHRDRFVAGECLNFSHDAYSIYDSCTGYFFQLELGQMKVWDLYDDEMLESWRELFRETR